MFGKYVVGVGGIAGLRRPWPWTWIICGPDEPLLWIAGIVAISTQLLVFRSVFTVLVLVLGGATILALWQLILGCTIDVALHLLESALLQRKRPWRKLEPSI